MKRSIQFSLASIVILLGLTVFALPVNPASAIDVFKDACKTESGTAIDGTATDTGTTGGTNTGSTGGVGGAATEGTDVASGDGGTSGGSSSSICGAVKQDDAPKIVTNVINTILFVLGIAAVVMIVIGGIRYTTSNGDPGNVKSAKDTILYAVVGLVVAMLAFLIVNFVIDRLGK